MPNQSSFHMRVQNKRFFSFPAENLLQNIGWPDWYEPFDGTSDAAVNDYHAVRNREMKLSKKISQVDQKDDCERIALNV